MITSLKYVRIYPILWILLGFFAYTTQASAINTEAVQVPILDHSARSLQQAMALALQQYLVAHSQNTHILQNRAVRQAIKNPMPFVQSYRYIKEDDTQKIILQVNFFKEMPGLLLDNRHKPTQNANIATSIRDAAHVKPGSGAYNKYTSNEASMQQNRGLKDEWYTTPNGESIPATQEQGQAVQLIVADVSTFADYTRLMAYLRRIPEIRSVSHLQTQGSRLLLRLQLLGSVQDLKQNIKADAWLVPVALPQGIQRTEGMTQLSYRLADAINPIMQDQAASAMQGTHITGPPLMPSEQKISSDAADAMTTQHTSMSEQSVTTKPMQSGRAPIVEGQGTVVSHQGMQSEQATHTQTFGIAPPAVFGSGK